MTLVRHSGAQPSGCLYATLTSNSASLACPHNEADELYFFLRAFFLAAFFAFLAMQIPLRLWDAQEGKRAPEPQQLN